MISRHHQTEAFRREQIRTSTDPAWMRDRFGIHQYSAFQIVGIGVLGLAIVLALSVVW